MAESHLYRSLEKYNETILNKYKDNWGSMLGFIDSKDIPKLQ